MNLASPAAVGEILRRHDIRPQKRFGQNFLVDGNVLRKIVESGNLSMGGQAFEIGAGLGVLTRALAEAVGPDGRVVTVEIDRGMQRVLGETLAGLGQVTLIEADVVALDLPAMLDTHFDRSRPISVVANIPYQITSPLIGALIAVKSRLSGIVLLVQREVADRIAAPPGSEGYGAFSVFCQFHAAVETIATVPATVFYPNPKVASAILRLTPRESPPVTVADEDTFFAVVRAAFGQRRKTVANALANDPRLGWDRQTAVDALAAAGIRPDVRGETLTLAEFAAVANSIAAS